MNAAVAAIWPTSCRAIAAYHVAVTVSLRVLIGAGKTYDQHGWARALTGIGIGGCSTHLFAHRGFTIRRTSRRARRQRWGFRRDWEIGLGQLLSGMVNGSTQSGWRMPFYFVALPGLALSLLFRCWRRSRGAVSTKEVSDLLASGQTYEERLPAATCHSCSW